VALFDHAGRARALASWPVADHAPELPGEEIAVHLADLGFTSEVRRTSRSCSLRRDRGSAERAADHARDLVDLGVGEVGT
jgi:hypothetical protein